MSISSQARATSSLLTGRHASVYAHCWRRARENIKRQRAYSKKVPCVIISLCSAYEQDSERTPRAYRCAAQKANPSRKKRTAAEHVGSGFRTHASRPPRRPHPLPQRAVPAPRALQSRADRRDGNRVLINLYRFPEHPPRRCAVTELGRTL
ncbi:unnamed protein product, partial [Iphiclides podalirius]